MALYICPQNTNELENTNFKDFTNPSDIFKPDITKLDLKSMNDYVQNMLTITHEFVVEQSIDWNTYEFAYTHEMYEQIEFVLCISHRISQIFEELNNRHLKGDLEAKWLIDSIVIKTLTQIPFMYLTKEMLFNQHFPSFDHNFFPIHSKHEIENIKQITNYFFEKIERKVHEHEEKD